MVSPRGDPARTAHPGLIARTGHRGAQLIGWLLFSLLFSIAMEWIGLTFWWPEEGADHSLQMYRTEIRYLAEDFRESLIADQPADFAAELSETAYQYVWEWTGLIRWVKWMGTPPPADATPARVFLHGLYEYAVATVNITHVFTVRVAILTLALPVFLLFGIVGLTDGLVQRDIRRWGGGRESGYVFHWATKFIIPAFFVTWLLYLSLPVSINPGLVVLPFALLFALTLRIAGTTFKKYL